MALASHVPATWDTILSTTMHNYRKTLTDNIFGSRVLLDYFMSKGRVRTIDGGISIVEPLLLGSGEADSYGPWQQIQVNPVGGISAAQFPWKQLYATIIINGLEEAQNNGKEQAINLIEAKVMQAEETLKNILSAMIWGTRGGAAKVTDFDSLITLVDGTAAAGGITPAAAPAIENLWRSPTFVVGTGGTDAKGAAITFTPALTNPLDAVEHEKLFRKMFNLASDGGADHVDAMFGASDTFEAYEASLTPQVRYTDTTKANLGFQNLMFKNVPLFWDPDAPAGTLLGLNSKYVGMTLHSERNFKQSPFTANLSGALTTGSGVGTVGTAASAAAGSPAGSANVAGIPAASTLDARVSFITTYGNMTTRERRRNFKITNMQF
jgi:hypothetical protein